MENRDTPQDFYSTHAHEYHERTAALDPSPFLSPLAQRLLPGSLVLDVGCSSGRDLFWFKNRGFNVLGLERAADLALMARERAGCEVLEGDFESFDFSSLSVDALCLIASLVHVPPAHLPAVLSRMLPALRPRGLVLLTMKEGEGTSSDGRGRTFHLWKDGELRLIFGERELSVVHFERRESLMATGEVWLEYVLEAGGSPPSP